MQRGRPTLVLADDRQEMLEAVSTLLGTHFRVVNRSSDGASALAAVRALAPDLAVLDIAMPRINGIEVARQLRLGGAKTRIVFLTLHGDEEYLSEARQVAHGFVLKQHMHTDLEKALRAALEGEFFSRPLPMPDPAEVGLPQTL